MEKFNREKAREEKARINYILNTTNTEIQHSEEDNG